MKSKLTVGDVDLPTAKVNRVDAFVDAAQDFLRVTVPGQHVGVCHPGHWQVSIAFPPSITCWPHAHQSRIQPILHIADQTAGLNERIVAAGRAFIIDAQTATTISNRAIVNNRDTRCSNHLAHHAAVQRCALAVEVTFETVPDSFMQ